MIDQAAAWKVTEKLLDNPNALADITAELGTIGKAALEEKAQGIQGSATTLSLEENCSRVKTILTRLAFSGGEKRPFDAFREICEQELAGIVFTAHPTFALSEQARLAMHARLRGEKAQDQITRFEPARSPSLDEELYQAEDALKNLRAALRLMWGLFIDVAADLYPDDWKTLTPRIMTLASWVGFDLDGRTDISWTKSQQVRYRMAFEGLSELLVQVGYLQEYSENADFGTSTTLISQKLAVLKDCFKEGSDALDTDSEDQHRFALLNRLAVKNRPIKEEAMTAVDEALAKILAMDLADDLLKAVAAFRAEWVAIGMGLSHIHFRVNAAQLHNAIRPEIGLQRSPDRSASRRHYLQAIDALLNDVEPVNIHYGTLSQEMTTARRVFMLAAQFEKHFDGRTPIRMLVAESDTPFTLLVALYFARQFGVDDHVEISPLFETETGLQRGDQVIRELVENEHFLKYIRKQGRFCVQLGFSDSGRYIGQIAASLAVERFKLRLVRLWKSKGLSDVQLLFFDTHGESIGRGAHPGSLTDRFLTTHTPAVRWALKELAADYKHEVSFQGGDGFLWFVSPEMSLAVLTDLLEARIPEEQPLKLDPFYTENGWALDFFLTLKEQQEHMVVHPGYLELINAWGSNLLFPSGSRASRRQGGPKSGNQLESISGLRAIPNNAILHQFGYLANTLVGLGRAVSLAPDRFQYMMENSRRFRRLMAMATAANCKSNLYVLESYIKLVRPGAWLDLADKLEDTGLRGRVRRLSELLDSEFNQHALAQLLNDWRRDAGKRADILRDMGAADQIECMVDPDLLRLHTLRLGIIQFIFIKAMEVPRFSSRSDVQLTDLLEQTVHLNVDYAVEALRKIFPADPATVDQGAYGEDNTYVENWHGYAQEHAAILDPMEQAFGIIPALSSVIALKIGAFG